MSNKLCSTLMHLNLITVMAKSKASKEPPKVKEEEIVAESEEPAPIEQEAVEEVPSAVTPPIILETPIEAHLAQIVIERFVF